jgi:hypothetical protein
MVANGGYSTWAIEWFEEDGRMWIEDMATVEHVDCYERIGVVQGSYDDARKWADDWLLKNGKKEFA